MKRDPLWNLQFNVIHCNLNSRQRAHSFSSVHLFKVFFELGCKKSQMGFGYMIILYWLIGSALLHTLLHMFSVKSKFCLWRDPLWNLQLQCNQSIVTWILDKGHNSLLAMSVYILHNWTDPDEWVWNYSLAAIVWQIAIGKGVVVADHTILTTTTNNCWLITYINLGFQ